MDVRQSSMSGTMESSDVMVTIRPNPDKGLYIQIRSNVLAQFGDAIRRTTQDVLASFDVTDAIVEINDKGAIDCVIRARVQTAVCRALGIGFNWREENAP